jgi:hypothetical protein
MKRPRTCIHALSGTQTHIPVDKHSRPAWPVDRQIFFLSSSWKSNLVLRIQITLHRYWEIHMFKIQLSWSVLMWVCLLTYQLMKHYRLSARHSIMIISCRMFCSANWGHHGKTGSLSMNHLLSSGWDFLATERRNVDRQLFYVQLCTTYTWKILSSSLQAWPNIT